MQGASFDNFCKLMRASSGLELTGQKAYLVASRLAPVAQRLGFRGVLNLLDHLQTTPDPAIISAVVEAMATHKSLFFRDNTPFEKLRSETLPALSKLRAPRKVRIWSAACSSGQEPYSIAITALECAAATTHAVNVEIVATDISKPILEKARAGIYTDFETARGLSPERLQKYFVKQGTQHCVRPLVGRLVAFSEHNLLDNSRRLGSFDIVFCRNVLIYFDKPTKEKVLAEIAKVLARDGVLFLGSAETLLGLKTGFVKDASTNGCFRLA